MSLFKQYLEMITTASLGNWSQNPNGIGFDMPLEAARRIKKKSVMQGLNRRQYAKMIGTTENFYNKELKKVFSEQKNSVYRHEIIPIIDFINKYIKRKIKLSTLPDIITKKQLLNFLKLLPFSKRKEALLKIKELRI